MKNSLALALLFAVTVAKAVEPIAALTAADDVQINGSSLGRAARNWPVAAGDEIVTTASSAVLAFSEGARITLGRGTKAVLVQCDRPVVQLLEGSLMYLKPADSMLEICAAGRRVRPAPKTQGTVTIVPGPAGLQIRTASPVKALLAGPCACDAGAARIDNGPKKTR